MAYYHTPGFKPGSPDTASEAAESMKVIAPAIRDKVFAAISVKGWDGATGDVVAGMLDLTPVVRARVAELHAAKRIADSGRREVLGSGRRGVVWVLPVR